MPVLPHEAKALLDYFVFNQSYLAESKMAPIVLLPQEAKQKCMILHWRARLDRTDNFQKLCGSGLDWIQYHRIRTGVGLKNFTVRSSLLHTAMEATTEN